MRGFPKEAEHRPIVINARKPKLTVVARSFPPQVSGSAILLTNLLGNYHGNLSAIAGCNRYLNTDAAFLPPCQTRYLRFPRMLPRLYERLTRRLPALISRSIGASIRRALIKSRTDIVLAAYPSHDFLVGAFLAAREIGLPFYAYMHDLWLDQTSADTATARFTKHWEPMILGESTRVLCMTEAMQKHYEMKYGIKTYLLPHCVAEKSELKMNVGMQPPKLPKPTVLFVGAVSAEMNLDALKVLASASELLPSEYELLFCTSSDLATLNRLGVQSSRLRAKYVSRAEVQRLQSEAHVLVAPLSHKDCATDEVRTVFSTKILEYLVAGRPIIVFAPEDSYHVESARKNGWGYPVTEDSPAALAAAIQKVTEDENVAAKLVQGALTEARSRSATHQAERLQSWVIADCGHSYSAR
jgi:glycosyltransferase involved in cell wall biosynthesis